MRRALPLLLAGTLFLAAGPSGPRAVASPPEEAAPAGPTDEPAGRGRILASIDRGVRYLVEAQNENGSWGGTAPTLYIDIYAPVPGAYRAYEAATSALALSALLEVDRGQAGVADAIRRGTDWLIENHGARRASVDVVYNTWAHAYALEAFARLLRREQDESRRARIRAAADEAVKLLVRYEYVDGGWGYYDFNLHTQMPSEGYATTFTTASALVGLGMAAEQGIRVPRRIVDRARTMLRVCGFPSGAYAYSTSHKYWPQGGINQIKGSLARTPACVAGLALWDEKLPGSRAVKALDDLETYGHFLLIARKYPRPHEAWYQNSGYFCFYGYYYASMLLDDVPAEKRLFHAGRIAQHILPLQEQDGSFWDYQLYGYHKPYGTAYVLMTLQACLDALGPPSDAPGGG